MPASCATASKSSTSPPAISPPDKYRPGYRHSGVLKL
jgi:hypothetical protein